MFNESFYPTPPDLVKQMLSQVKHLLDAPGLCVLDPSAGKGDILMCLPTTVNKYAIEIEGVLREVLRGKKISVIGEDFLRFSGKYHIDLILMNPPFSAGAKHLLKAWDVVAPGGTIVCLLNAETILNPFSGDRKMIQQIISENGYTKAVGKAFADSERKTSVSVVMVVVKKPAQKNIFSDLQEQITKESQKLSEEFVGRDKETTDIATYDLIKSYVDQFKLIQALFIEYKNFETQLFNAAKGFFDLKYVLKHCDDNRKTTTNEILLEMNSRAWNIVFEKTNMSKILTSKARDEFHRSQAHQKVLNFNYSNILEFMSVIYENRAEIIKRCILDTFDKITSYDEKNKSWKEGWKTNSIFFINKKIIIPVCSEPINHFFWPRSNMDDLFGDLEKVLSYLSGKIVNTPTLDAMRQAHKLGIDSTMTDFFYIKMYKKGTVHLTFIDESLLNRFNQFVAKERGWLRESGRR